MQTLSTTQIVLDSHGHFYDCWNISLDNLLTCTYRNLSIQTPPKNTTKSLKAICLLDTEKDSTPVIDKLNNLPDQQWKIKNIRSEPCSFWATNQKKKLLIIYGKQINTHEGLEVTIIGESHHIKQGMKIETILEQKRDSTLIVIPWAAGKWTGKRGQILSELLRSPESHQFLLADNAGRPWIWSHIKQFDLASRKHLPILAGSDPLPIKDQFQQAGTYGNIFYISLDEEKPWSSIIQTIKKNNNIQRFGHSSSITQFLKNQLKLRL